MLFHFKGEELKPIFLPEVFLNYRSKIVDDFDNAMEDVLTRLKGLEEEQKQDITQIQEKLQEILETKKVDNKVTKVINESLERIEKIQGAKKLNKGKAIQKVEKRLKKEVNVKLPCGYLYNKEVHTRAREIWNLKNFKIQEIKRAKSDFVEKEVIDAL